MSKPNGSYAYILAATGFVIMLISYGSAYSFGVFFKPMSADFGWSRAETSLAYTFYQFFHGFFCIVVGRLADRFKPRLVITMCGVVLGLAFLLMSRADSLWQLYLNYTLVGLGVAAYVPLMSTVAKGFRAKRGLMTGIVISGIGAGTIVMPQLATRLIADNDWGLAYLVIGLLVLVVMLTAAQFVKHSPLPETESGGTVRALPDRLETQGFTPRQALRSRPFWMISAAYFTFLFAQQVMIVHIVPHATDLGMSAIAAAGIVSVIGGVSIAGRVAIGSASDRIGTVNALLVALGFITAGLFWLLGARDLWMFILFATIFGFGYGATVVIQSPIAADLFGLKSHGTILGMLVFVATIGGAVGPLAAGAIFDLTGAYQPAFILAAVLSVIGLALVFAVRFRSSRRKQPQPQRY